MAPAAPKTVRLQTDSEKFAMKSKAAQLVLLSQLSQFFFLFVCFLLNPHFLLRSNEGGASNYGLYAKTVVPYSLSLGLCGLFILLSARFIPAATRAKKILRWALVVVGIIFLLELASTYPYKINSTLDNIHIDIGVTLFIAATIMGVWFGLFLARNKINVLILSLELLGFILAALTFFGYLHVLFIAEQLTSLAFGILLIRTVSKIA